MNPPAHSRSYKFVKWQLARRLQKDPVTVSVLQKHAVTFSLVQSLLWSGIALLGGTRTMLNTTFSLLVGVMFLFSAYLEWERKGYREILEEQAKLLEEAQRIKASDLPPTPANAA